MKQLTWTYWSQMNLTFQFFENDNLFDYKLNLIDCYYYFPDGRH